MDPQTIIARRVAKELRNGDLVNLELVKSSGIPSLDQEVMFGARSSVFPIPPKNAPPVDRMFMVTYVYS